MPGLGAVTVWLGSGHVGAHRRRVPKAPSCPQLCRCPSRRLRAMTFEFVEFRRGAAAGHRWRPPFDWSVDYENPHWWDGSPNGVVDPWFIQVWQSGAEVARVEFDDPGGINPNYANVPPLGGERLEIQYIEMARMARRHGIGTRVVRALEDRHRDRRLFAYSMNADGFWANLGWEPFYDSRPGSAGSPLFIQPAM